jgi:DNA-binding NarL/FixJ family response regulator
VANRSIASLQVMAEVARVASGPGGLEQRAFALVEPLRLIMPFDSIWISLLDPELREQPPLLSLGNPDGLDQYLASPDGVAEVEAAGVTRRSVAMRLCELHTPPEEMRSWSEYLTPAGFRGGVAAGLFAADGRYLGFLGLATNDQDRPTPAERDRLGQLAPVIAEALDPMRSLITMAAIVHGSRAAVVLTRAGETIALPGLPKHPLLDPGSSAIGAVRALVATQTDYASFLNPSSDDEYAKVTWLRLGARPSLHLAGVVVLSPPSDTHDLDRTDLHILGMLIEGWPLPRIVAALAMSPATLGAHAECCVRKLGVESIDAAAVRALRLGLYMPASFPS